MDKKTFWNTRAKTLEHPGTNDFPLEKLELQALLSHIPPTATTLCDAGCGNGETLRYVLQKCPHIQKAIGFDLSDQMIQSGRERERERERADSHSNSKIC